MRLNIRLVLVALIFSFGQNAIAQDPSDLKEFETAKHLNKAKGQLVAGFIELGWEIDLLNGANEIPMVQLSSNFDGAYFQSFRDTLQLNQTISDAFIAWWYRAKQPIIVLEALYQNGELVHRIIGYTKLKHGFLPKEELFPEFADLKLLDFDRKKNRRRHRDKFLIGGSLKFPLLPEDKVIAVYYPTFNQKDNGKASDPTLFASGITLQEAIAPRVEKYLMAMQMKCFIFERIATETPPEGQDRVGEPGAFKLIGFSQDPFIFQQE